MQDWSCISSIGINLPWLWKLNPSAKDWFIFRPGQLLPQISDNARDFGMKLWVFLNFLERWTASTFILGFSGWDSFLLDGKVKITWDKSIRKSFSRVTITGNHAWVTNQEKILVVHMFPHFWFLIYWFRLVKRRKDI